MLTNVAVIIVRYENNINYFSEMVMSLAQTMNVYIYDNSKESIVFDDNNIYYYHDQDNGGLAKAINHCVDVALSDKKELAVYFDQDSLIDNDLIEKLVLSYRNLKSKFNNIFVVGPQPIMKNGDEYPIKILTKIEGNYFNTSEIITSGMTFKLEDVRGIGYFDLDMFLDMVDYEICWRAKAKGLKIIVDKNITMIHEVGVNTIKIPFKILPISSPIRNYYQTRNVLYLILYKHRGSFFSILYSLIRRFANITINLLFADKKYLRLKYNVMGIRDAFSKNMGKLK